MNESDASSLLATFTSGRGNLAERVVRLGAALAGHPPLSRSGLDAVLAKVAHPQDRAVLLLSALREGPLELAQRLLVAGVRVVHPAASGETDAAFLIGAVARGATGLLAPLVEAGALVNRRDRGGQTALHHVVLASSLDAPTRGALALELLRLLAVPERAGRGRPDVFRLAATHGCVEVVEVLREHAYAFGPRQCREARQRRIRDLCLLYEKADGFIYRIGLPDTPFLVGGDYDGAREVGALEAAGAFSGLVRVHPELEWFTPFMDRLERGAELELDALLAASSRARTYAFGERANWD